MVYFESPQLSKILSFSLLLRSIRSILHLYAGSLTSIKINIQNASHHLQIVNHGGQVKHCAHYSHKLPFIPSIFHYLSKPANWVQNRAVVIFTKQNNYNKSTTTDRTILRVFLALLLKAKFLFVILKTLLHRHSLCYS